LEKYHRNFVRSGAALNPAQKAKLREINKELALAELAFGQNVLDETNSYQKVVDNEADLAGLPESVRQAAAETNTVKTVNCAKNCCWLIPPGPTTMMPKIIKPLSIRS
jgi:Zn-dependent oligopeptidase